jgi:hypothetical protein
MISKQMVVAYLAYHHEFAVYIAGAPVEERGQFLCRKFSWCLGKCIMHNSSFSCPNMPKHAQTCPTYLIILDLIATVMSDVICSVVYSDYSY